MKKIALIVIQTFILILIANAQEIRGIVLDINTQSPLSNATIEIKSKGEEAKKIYSNNKGEFNVNVKEGAMLFVTYIGYNKATLKIKNSTNIYKIELTPISEELEEVQVTASLVGSRSQKAIGANVAHIKTSDIIEKTNPNSLAQVLNGRVSGVQAYNTNGKVGMPIRFDIRSAATFSMDRDPLIFIDGVRYNNSNVSDINSSQDAMSALNDLPMNDIETIDFIKGPAAAASYGAEAANGVVVIKTKKGSITQKKGVAINLRYTNGYSILANKYDKFVNNTDINKFFQTGIQHQVYAGLSNVLDGKNKIYFSANINQNKGTIPGNEDKRNTLRFGYDFNKKKLKFSVGLTYVNGELTIPPSASGRNDALWNLMRNESPWQLVLEKTWRNIQNKYNNNRLTSSFNVTYQLPWAIKVESILGVDINYIIGENYLPAGFVISNQDLGHKNLSNRNNQNLNWDAKISKSFTINTHWKIQLSALSQLTRAYEYFNTIAVRGFSDANVSNISTASQINAVNESTYEKRTQGIYTEAFLGYKDKLFINTGIRRDASNIFGANIASVWYPAISIAYNVKKIPFTNIKLDNLKLRVAYGESGRLPFPNDAQTAYILKNTPYGIAALPSRLGNPNIKPERTREVEFGTDISFAKHKLNFTYYFQNTNDAIIYTTALPSNGWPSVLSGDYPENIGSIRGSGLELSYNVTVFTSANKNTSLQFFTVFNYQQNKVVNTGGRDIISNANIVKEGLPVFAFYEKVSTGAVYDANGKYKNASASEMKYLGKPFPTYTGSMGVDFQFLKNASISMLFTFAQGAKVYNISHRNIATQGNNFKASETLKTELETLTPNTEEYKVVAEKLANYAIHRGNYIQPADFIRLSNLTFSYDLSDIINKLSHNKIKGMQISITANNLWLKTNYGGVEPQIDAQGGSRRTRGISSLSTDWTNVPAPKTISFSLNLKF